LTSASPPNRLTNGRRPFRDFLHGALFEHVHRLGAVVNLNMLVAEVDLLFYRSLKSAPPDLLDGVETAPVPRSMPAKPSRHAASTPILIVRARAPIGGTMRRGCLELEP
jgi:hypothetical protein